jgi:glycosyltransferase involved in cell wall biosynthesis
MLGLPSIYAPHGGSLHYAWTSPAGAAFLSVEKMLARTGSGLHFVCEYERRAFDAKIGIGGKANAVVHNGLWPGEFTDVPLREGAADLLFIGDMRKLKGVDVFLDALAICKSAHSVTALFAGDGPDLSRFREHADKLGIAEHVEFAGRMAVEEAFSRGDIVVLPSRAESLPYVILEAGAAGRPVIATGVGGIPEILGPESLVPPGDAVALAGRILEFLGDPCTATARAKAFRSRLVNDFSVDSMVNRVLALYQAVLLDRS